MTTLLDSGCTSFDEGTTVELVVEHNKSLQESNECCKEDWRENEISTKESKAVNRLRFAVFAVLFVAGTVVAVIVFNITSDGEQSEFEGQYFGIAEQLAGAFDGIVTKNFGVIGALRVSLMAHAVDHHRVWPFVTLSSFQRRSSTVLRLSNSLYVGVYPLVKKTDVANWTEYVQVEGPNWMQEAIEYKELSGINFTSGEEFNINQTLPPIHYMSESGMVVDDGPGPFLPLWESSPMVASGLNNNLLRSNSSEEAKLCIDSGKAIIGHFMTSEPGGVDSANENTASYAAFLSTKAQQHVQYEGDLVSNVALPVFGSYKKDDKNVVGVVVALIQWGSYFENILPNQAKGVTFILENPCQGPYTYEVDGGKVRFKGKGELYEKKFEKFKVTASFDVFDHIQDGTEFGIDLNNTYCPVSIRIYPSLVFRDMYHTQLPISMTCTVLLVFTFAAFMFLMYDRLVERRQHFVLTKALQSRAIVSSLFPRNVADRILKQSDSPNGANHANHMSNKSKIKNFLSPRAQSVEHEDVQPIADLFPHTTVLFADIVGFTAWSSSRDPLQVFVLLQGVYQSFDAIAKRRKVFKVETIGDSYVAVTGLPDPQENHALIMARFAHECSLNFAEVTEALNSRLGPGTSDLTMRMGMHSGPVTGGVLIGDRARFQLFGDTVNTAARMESTGQKNRIQISPSTASLLIEAGKEHWITAREDVVNAKGKGILNTFWLTISPTSLGYNTEPGKTTAYDLEVALKRGVQSTPDSSDLKHARMLDWICELFQDHLSKVVSFRGAVATKKERHANTDFTKATPLTIDGSPPIDEVVESIVLPEFTEMNSSSKTSTTLGPVVLEELRQYFTTLASTYNANPFHNFEHACHVTMSVNKLLKRVVAPDIDVEAIELSSVSSHLHNYTLGISHDPITQLAIIFSAIIHDADHRGVSNVQLGYEDVELANMYRHKSVAEQNSLDVAWRLLMSDRFQELRRCMFATENEFRRFRQIVVNTVLATDIFDKELNDLRKYRWAKAFSVNSTLSLQERKNLQATIVIEHIIQASDVAHAMQHWYVYREWNFNLFKEMYLAYTNGRMEQNPCEFWYAGELLFFDNYIIPLAKKLKECNVFGVSSDEYLNYAEKNRTEWEARGQDIVTEMINELSDIQKQVSTDSSIDIIEE